MLRDCVATADGVDEGVTAELMNEIGTLVATNCVGPPDDCNKGIGDRLGLSGDELRPSRVGSAGIGDFLLLSRESVIPTVTGAPEDSDSDSGNLLELKGCTPSDVSDAGDEWEGSGFGRRLGNSSDVVASCTLDGL